MEMCSWSQKSMPLNLFSLDLKYICDTRPMCSRFIFFKRNKRKRFQIPEKAQGTLQTAQINMMFDSLIENNNILIIGLSWSVKFI